MQRGSRQATTLMPVWEATEATYYTAPDGTQIETSGQYQTVFPTIEQIKDMTDGVQLRWDFTSEMGQYKYTFVSVPDVMPNTLISYSVPQYIIDEIWNY